jgi:hypothetical protein
MDLKPLSSPARIKFPASQFNGLLASGWFNNEIIARQSVDNVQAGLQEDFKMSKQISPVFFLILKNEKL